MKRSILFIVFLLSMVIESSCQILDYESYLRHYSFYHKLKPEFLNWTVAPEQMKSLTEIRIDLDSLGNENDTICLYRYSFDELGQLIQKQFIFDQKGTKYISISYSYVNGVCVDTIVQSQYDRKRTTLDGAYLNTPKSIEYKFDRERRITNSEVTFWDGQFEFISLDYFYRHGKIETIEVYTNEGNHRYEFAYEYYEKKKY